MVRGNWQRRVELIESRRNEAKQKKQRNEEKKSFKRSGAALLAMLDRNKDGIRQRTDASREIHIWTDSLPSDAPPVLDMVTDDSKTSKRRNRSASIEGEGGGKVGRSNAKKKAHPRSKESKESMVDPEEDVNTPRLCRSQFFSGKCENQRGGKKSGCPHVHYPNNSKTLACILMNKADESLSLSESAVPDSHIDDTTKLVDSGGMEMLYYFSIKVTSEKGGDTNESLSDHIVSALSKKACSVGSIVYLVMNDHLLYDRYREGLVMTENDFIASSIGLSGTRSGECQSGSKSGKAALLPGSVLEYVLTFLPDTAVASMSSVCRSWNREIGKESANLWRFLLERRKWPVPTSVDHNDSDGSRFSFFDAFLSNYSALREMKAVKAGMTELLTKKLIETKEACYKSFESVRGAPQYPNHCISLEVWSPNRVLAAYSHDCTLRLFDTTDKSGTGGERLCRELICQRIDPYKNTKKQTTRLVALALDENYIGCLCRVLEDNVNGEAFVLIVVGREDFLVTDDGNMQVIDLGQSVLDFLLSCDEVDHGLLQLNEFLSDDGELDDVEVLVSESIIDCGNGRFLFEGAVSIPSFEDEDEDGSGRDMTLLFRRLFLISVSTRAIVRMCGSSPPSSEPRPRQEGIVLASVRTIGRSLYGCKFAAASPVSPAIAIGSIEQNVNLHNLVLLKGSELSRNEIFLEGWELLIIRQRPIVVLPSEVVVADTFAREIEGGRKNFKSIVSFYSSLKGNLPRTLELEGNLEVCLLVPFKVNIILVICRQRTPPPDQTEVDNVDGHWFADSAHDQVSLCAVIIHISSTTEIERVSLIDDLVPHLGPDVATSGELPVKVAVSAGTVAASVWWKGVVITGEEARLTNDDSPGYDHAQASTKAKKKKKKTPKKGGKKDGFARGMSLRG